MFVDYLIEQLFKRNVSLACLFYVIPKYIYISPVFQFITNSDIFNKWDTPEIKKKYQKSSEFDPDWMN